MIHPHTELRRINSEIGYRVVATRFIPKGTITWVLDPLDRELTPTEVEGLDELYRRILSTYCFRNKEGNYVLCWDNGRYVNHSFQSNCLTTAYNFELAVRDIHPGQELTDDYGYLNITEPFEAIDEGLPRKVVYPDDLLRYHRGWDRKLRGAFRRLSRVDQPLRPIMNEDVWQTAVEVGGGRREMTSILDCYCAGAVAPASGVAT